MGVALMSRVIYGPDDGPLSTLNLQGDKCPKCYGKNHTAKAVLDARGEPCGAHLDCLDCGHLWGWTV